MKIIIPMAGIGKRMRPHTLTVPKPLIRIAGKPIVQRLIEDLSAFTKEKIEEIAFIIGDFGKEVEEDLIKIAAQSGVKGKIYYQEQALGTAHAILCAADSLEGEVIVAFADTLFKSDFKINNNADSIIWVHKVANPSAFGVVITDDSNLIRSFAEKPKEFISDLAIIGIYYFRDALTFRKELEYLIDNKLMKDNEYQLTDALVNMLKKDKKMITAPVDEWLDCGNKNATVFTNQRILHHQKNEKLISETAKIINSIIIAPCYIGDKVEIINSIVGPYVSVGENTKIDKSVISNSIVQNSSTISCVTIENSMIGNYVYFKGELNQVSIGDFTVLD